MTFDEFKASLPEAIVNDKERLLGVCKAANIEVPLDERFYVKTHTPKVSKRNPEPEATEYVVIPHPLGGRDFWVRKADFASLIAGANTFKDKLGL